MPCTSPYSSRRSDRRYNCGWCTFCKQQKKDSMVGRLMAEGLSSARSWFLSLTYKDEPDRFIYRDVQLMLKRLREHLFRKHLCTVRFFCVGEYGGVSHRRHWHLLVFLDKMVAKPVIPQGTLWDMWPHGWTSISIVDPTSVEGAKKLKYCAKYCFKDHGERSVSSEYETVRARWSVKPVLGYKYLIDKACLEVNGGFAPSPSLMFNACRVKGGRRFEYRLTGRALRLYLLTYAAEHHRVTGDWSSAPLLERHGLIGGPMHLSEAYLVLQRNVDAALTFETARAAIAGQQLPLDAFHAVFPKQYVEVRTLLGRAAAVAYVEEWRKTIPDHYVFYHIPSCEYEWFENAPVIGNYTYSGPPPVYKAADLEPCEVERAGEVLPPFAPGELMPGGLAERSTPVRPLFINHRQRAEADARSRITLRAVRLAGEYRFKRFDAAFRDYVLKIPAPGSKISGNYSASVTSQDVAKAYREFRSFEKKWRAAAKARRLDDLVFQLGEELDEKTAWFQAFFASHVAEKAAGE